jgi:putative SOS response-associated peptidase YedK
MCNLYCITIYHGGDHCSLWVLNRYVRNLPPMPGVFPDYPAPVVRNVDTERELTLMLWGCRRQWRYTCRLISDLFHSDVIQCEVLSRF